MPDGTPVSMPDNPSPEQLAQLHAINGQAQDPSYMSRVGDNLKFGGSALARGVASLPALAVDATAAVGRNTPDWMSNILPPVAASKAVAALHSKLFPDNPMGMSGGLTNFGVQPTTPTEKNVASIIEGVGGGLGAPGALKTGATAARAMFTGGVAGEGADIGGRLTNDSWWGRVLGGLAGGLAGGGASAIVGAARPQSAAVAKDAVMGITDKQLQEAAAFMAKSKAVNPAVEMDLAQALRAIGVEAPNMNVIRDTIANRTQGQNLQGILQRQPAQFRLAADDALSNLPGPTWSREIAANNVQQAATDTLQAVKKQRGEAVDALYKAAGPVSEDTRQALISRVNEVISQPGTTPDVKATGQYLIGVFSGKGNNVDNAVQEARMLVLGADGGSARAAAREQLAAANSAATAAAETPLHALDVKTALNQAAGKFKGTPTTPPDPESFGQAKYLVGGLRPILTNDSAPLLAANKTFEQLSHDVVDPMKKGPIGQLATPRGALPDIPASVAKMEAYFKAGSDPALPTSVNPIPYLANGLKAADPEAFPAAAKAFIRQRLDEASPAVIDGKPLNTGKEAADVYRSLFATTRQMQGMRDIAAGVARSYDFTPDQTAGVVRGMENLAKLSRGLASQPSKAGGMTSGEANAIAGGSAVATVVRVAGWPFNKVGNMIENATMGKTWTEFDRLLSSPEGAATLLKLSKVPYMSEKAATILNSFWGTVPASQTPGNLPAGQ
jgi:hypothetical protein